MKETRKVCEECGKLKPFDSRWRRAKKSDGNKLTVCPECVEKLIAENNVLIYSV